MEQENKFYKGICEEQTKKIEELKKELEDEKKDAWKWFQKYKDLNESVDVFVKQGELERLALLKKITSLKEK